MKKLYTLILLAFTGSLLMAQTYYVLPAVDAGFNPGNLNNDPEQPLGATGPGWNSVMTTSAVDAWSTTQAMPFSFDLAGTSFTQYRVSSSGVLTFDMATTATPGTTPALLPSPLLPPNSICAWGLNLSGTNDQVINQTFGTAPNRQHWVTFASASHSSLGTGSQWTYWSIVLEETTNAIYVVDQRTYSATAGANVAMTVGVQVSMSDYAMVGGSPSLGSNTTATGGNQSDPLDNTFYEFVAGTQPTYDVALASVNMPSNSWNKPKCKF